MSLVYNSNKFQYAVSQSLPFGEVRRGSSFNAYNSMKAYSYNGERYGYYGYDASGERTYKYDMYTAGSWTNQTGGMDVSLQIDKMMLYPNGYLNMNQNGEYTKHYYADALRIASKIGSGFSQDLCYEANQIGNEVDPGYLDQRMYKQYEEMKEELSELIDGNQVMDILPTSYPDANLCNLSGSGIETALFFYHPDHLGSTGMVTNNSSNFTQGMLYAPFGEIISDYNPTFHDSPMPNYAFNAKELDEENNMYYYSARYYAPPTFISRDPMFEKYPSISPYTYCKNNPVKRIDPDGKYDYEVDLETKKITRTGEKGSPDKFIIKKKNGETVAGKEYAAGTITLKEHDNGRQSCKVKGDKNGKEMFEFLAKNTNVEWGHLQTGKGGTNGDNYLFTSYEEGKVSGFTLNGLGINDYIRTFKHNHPSGNSKPSDADFDTFQAIENYNLSYSGKHASFYIFTNNGNYAPKYTRMLQEVIDDMDNQFFQEMFSKPSR